MYGKKREPVEQLMGDLRWNQAQKVRNKSPVKSLGSTQAQIPVHQWSHCQQRRQEAEDWVWKVTVEVVT